MTAKRLDTRRLIGPNIAWNRVGALLEVGGSDDELNDAIPRWQDQTLRLMAGLGWSTVDAMRIRRYTGGALLIIASPIDVLYAATEVVEAAWDLALGETNDTFDRVLERLVRERDDESDPAALALFNEAKRRGMTCFLDEKGVSLGMGIHGRFWSPRTAPPVDEIDWDAIDDIPAALVTGTNGKTTTVRMMRAILTAANFNTALSSTDWISVGDEIIDTGDYSGPGGARQVLRHPEAEVAVLETARGGLLWRGLAVHRARAALVTNIAADHLGDGGVNDLESLADVKFMVTRAVTDDGEAVINFDDELCRRRGEGLDCAVHWFSCTEPPADADPATFVRDGIFIQRRGGSERSIMPVANAAITMGGHAPHNIANAVAAIAVTSTLGASDDAIRTALETFGNALEDNPGRGNIVAARGARFLIDFAHNPHGMRSILQTAKSLVSGAGRLGVAFGQAGDRTDQDIEELARVVAEFNPDFVVINALDKHCRGRAVGEVAAMICRVLNEHGIRGQAISQVGDDLASAKAALEQARDGDVVMMFVPEAREDVTRLLQQAAADS